MSDERKEDVCTPPPAPDDDAKRDDAKRIAEYWTPERRKSAQPLPMPTPPNPPAQPPATPPPEK